jgi:hypothetical protein
VCVVQIRAFLFFRCWCSARAPKFTNDYKALFFVFLRRNKKCKIRFFLACEAKKKTIARILLKLPHANDKNAMRLSIRTGE